jgi:glycogen debranching enzyme
MWSLPLGDKELTECGRQSLDTILGAQSRDGHLPNYVDIATGEPQFGGIGNIAGIDSALWIVIATWNYVKITGDTAFARKHFDAIHRTMKWLRAHDSNNCGLLEIPEASDWTDLFPRSYNVLYDEVLWYRANVDFVELRKLNGLPVDRYIDRAVHIRKTLNEQFWPTPGTLQESTESFARTQFSMGRTRYLIAQITPFGFSWRCDVFGNIIASLYGVLSDNRADLVRQFLRQISIDHPHPVKVLYPVIHPGEPDWRDYFLVNLQNLPHHYHNGGIWPFVGGLWVRFLDRLGRHEHAHEALGRLAEVCRDGIEREWEFNEWAHGQTGRPMGKAFQAWSAASYVAAYLRFQGDTSIEVAEEQPDELTQRGESGLAPTVTDGAIDLNAPAPVTPPPQ